MLVPLDSVLRKVLRLELSAKLVPDTSEVTWHVWRKDRLGDPPALCVGRSIDEALEYWSASLPETSAVMHVLARCSVRDEVHEVCVWRENGKPHLALQLSDM